MSNFLIQDTTLTGIANAIRTKKGTSALIPVSDFASEISNLHDKYIITGSNLQYTAFLAYLINNGVEIDTNGVTNMTGWFYGSTIIPQVVNIKTNNVTNMSYMFAQIPIPSALDLSSLKTSNVTNMSHMFESCACRPLDVSGFNTSNVTDMSNMFMNLTGVQSLDITNFDTSNVVDMRNMFNDCRALTSLSLDRTKFDTQKVTTMSSMFYNCSGLTTLDVSRFSTKNVTAFTGMFRGCSSLTTLDLSLFDTRNATDMSGTFRGCSSLSSITFGQYWKSYGYQTYTDQTTGTWTNTVTGVSYTGLQNLLVAGRTLGAIEGTWVKS